MGAALLRLCVTFVLPVNWLTFGVRLHPAGIFITTS